MSKVSLSKSHNSVFILTYLGSLMVEIGIQTEDNERVNIGKLK